MRYPTFTQSTVVPCRRKCLDLGRGELWIPRNDRPLDTEGSQGGGGGGFIILAVVCTVQWRAEVGDEWKFYRRRSLMLVSMGFGSRV